MKYTTLGKTDMRSRVSPSAPGSWAANGDRPIPRPRQRPFGGPPTRA
jgi:hypothetical protein